MHFVCAWRRVAFIALVLGYPVCSDARAKEVAAQNQTKAFTRPATPSVQDSLKRIASTIESSQNGLQAQQDRQRARDNLSAQQNMAHWALGAMIAALIEVLISAAGIFLIWRTLIHTRDAAKATQRMAFDNPAAIAAAVEGNNAAREANEISRQTMAAENRAWIEIEILTVGDLLYQDGQFQLGVQFLFRNIGKTVALNVAPGAELVRDPMTGNRKIGEIPEELREVFGRLKGRPRKLFAQNIFPGRQSPIQDYTVSIDADKVELQVEGKGTNLFPMSLVIGVQYNTIFDRLEDEAHETIEFSDLRRLHEGRPSLVIVGKGSVPANEMNLLRSAENWGVVT